MRLSFLDRRDDLGPAFGRLLLSDAQTLLALMVGQVATPWWIAGAGGAHDLAVYGVFNAALSIAAMPLMAPLGDRVPKRRLIRAALLAFAAAAAAVALMASVGAYDLRLVLALGVVPVLAGAALLPAMSSLVVEVVPAAGLSPAMGLQQGAQAAGRLVGPALGGAVVATAGTAAALWLNCALLVGASFSARGLPGGVVAARARRGWRAELVAGMRANWRIPIERGWILANFLSWIFLGPTMTMLVPLKVQALGLSGLWLGLCEAGLSLGLLVGSLGGSQWLVDRFGRFATRVGSAALQGLALALAGATGHPALLVACFAVAGVLSAVMMLVGKTHRMLARPLAYRARMIAGAVTTVHVAGMIGPALAGFALLHAGVVPVFVAFGVLGGLFALTLAFVPGLRAFMALGHEEVDHYYERAYPRAFAGD